MKNNRLLLSKFDGRSKSNLEPKKNLNNQEDKNT